MVLWGLAKKIPSDQLPPRRVVVRFDIPDGERPRYWLLLQRPRAEVCATAPGFDVDLAVTTTSERLAKWHTGRISLGHAMRGHTSYTSRDREAWSASSPRGAASAPWPRPVPRHST